MTDTETYTGCEGCALAGGRRHFLRTTTRLTGGWALLAFLPRSVGRWLKNDHHYDIPASDDVVIDRDNQVILVRWKNVVYAFALSCPHQNTALRWDEPDTRFQCPKHHSKYQPDGTFISGRATRNMDRLAIKKDDKGVSVDLDTLYKSTDDADKWKAAFVSLNPPANAPGRDTTSKSDSAKSVVPIPNNHAAR